MNRKTSEMRELMNGFKSLSEKVVLTEISPELFKSALRGSVESGRWGKVLNLTKIYFREFEGIPFMGGKIEKIECDPMNIFITFTEAGLDRPQKLIYDIEKDEYNDFVPDHRSRPISRQDARTLFKIAKKVNADTRYSKSSEFSIDNY